MTRDKVVAIGNLVSILLTLILSFANSLADNMATLLGFGIFIFGIWVSVEVLMKKDK